MAMFLVYQPPKAGAPTPAIAPNVRAVPWRDFVADYGTEKGFEGPEIIEMPANNLSLERQDCRSAWDFDADRRAKSLMQLARAGSIK